MRDDFYSYALWNANMAVSSRDILVQDVYRISPFKSFPGQANPDRYLY